MKHLSLTLILSLCSLLALSQSETIFNAKNFKGLELRNIGPAFTSGRIADIAIHPDNENIWYVAVGSGGVWKTTNAGVTWKPIFDSQSTYSIGCITIDPSNPHTIWVGSGENVGGRHVGFGDGIYKSEDDGKSWKNMGLTRSEHISKIVVHPDNSDVLWVAVQGPLWTSGGERGLYKSTNGGQSWKKTLGDDVWTGVTDLVIDPRNPQWLYAATWDRHRTVAAYMGGGPGSGLHRSTDGGETWRKLTSGIPKSNLGKIGLAISPQNPDVLYAAIELDRTTGGVFMSTNRGMSWVKQSDAVSGATGPHYYQELYASPHAEGRLYLVNNSMLVSDDFVKNFRRMKRDGMHSDSHSINFKESDPDFLLVGTDGGIYQSYDLAQTWQFIDNMPITQYYKVAVDDAAPFYWVYGGTQDNGSHGGPSRTDTWHGIRNADWVKTLGADGHQSATEPGNPNIIYAETQQGGLHRVDRITGDQVYIQPQPGEGEGYERFNWDAPIVVSEKSPSTIYFASYRVWKSTNRGDSWTAISGDLTRNEERITLPIMGKTQSWDNAWDVGAMSNYNTITSLGVSMLQDGLVYAGTDDGIVQVTEDDGGTWRKVDFKNQKSIPSTGFVNDIRADIHDENVVYMAMDNHKYGDFRPYIFRSGDKGKTWTSISGDLQDRTLVWRIVQDHVNKDLLFIGTENGIYFTVNGGKNWIKLEGGVPTIPFRDLTIQRRENDLVGASFGRSFFILDDISPLRQITEETNNQEATLFTIKDALWYSPRSIVSSQGAGKYFASNPPFGAVFTYYLKEKIPSLEDSRKKREKDLSGNVPFPGWESLESEDRQERPGLFVIIKDEDGMVINTVKAKNKSGINRVSWNLRRKSGNGVQLGDGVTDGFSALPGKYTATLVKVVDGVTTELDEAQEFNVIPLRNGALPNKDFSEFEDFRSMLEEFQQEIRSTGNALSKALERIDGFKVAFTRSDNQPTDLLKRIHDSKMDLIKLDSRLNGSETKGEIGEREAPNPRNRMFVGYRALSTTYGPTEMHKSVVQTGRNELKAISTELEKLLAQLEEIESELIENGAPWIEGQGIKN